MSRGGGLAAGVGRVLLGLGALTLPRAAPGAVPPVLDSIPADSFAVVAVENLGRLDENSSQFMAAIEMDAVSTFSQALGAMGLRDGLDMGGSAGCVFFRGDEEGAGPEPLLVVPVSDYGALMKSLKAERDGTVDRFEYAKQPYFAREIGAGFAAAGRDRALVESFAGAPGQMPAHLRLMGERGRQVASGADIVMLADTSETRDLLAGLLGPAVQGATGLGLPLEEVGGDPRESLIHAILERVEQEGTRGVVGISAGPLGVRLDLATGFREGTFMRSASEGEAKAGEPFGALPAGEYLFLGSMDFTHPGLRALVAESLARQGAGAGDANAQLIEGVLRTVQETDRATVALYAPPNPFLGMLANGVIVWDSENPGAGVEAFREWLGSIDGRQITGAMLRTSFRPGAQRVGDVSASAWSVGAKEGSLGPQMALLYASPAGPQGFVGSSERRGYLTWTKDPAVFERAVRAGGDESVGDDVMLQQVRALLPGPRAIEWYINARPLLAQALSVAGQKADLPELLPPIGAGVVMSDGSLLATIFVPAPLIRSSFGIMEQVGGALGR